MLRLPQALLKLQKPNFSPHFPRIFSANTFLLSQKILFWTFLTLFILINIYTKANLTPTSLDKAILVFLKPHALNPYIELARFYWKEGHISLAKQQLLLAQEQLQNNNVLSNARSGESAAKLSVLGLSTSPLLLINEWENEPENIAKLYTYWQNVIRNKPDYKDAYILLGGLSYRLSKLKEASEYFQKALELDPSLKLATQYLELLQKNK